MNNDPSALAGLRDSRLALGMTQQDVANRVGVRQRQISDLERAAMDPRLSTVTNVARALDLEVMLVPRALVATVEALRQAGGAPIGATPMYSLDADMDERDGSDDSRAVKTDWRA